MQGRLLVGSLLVTAALACAAVTHAEEPTPRIQQDVLLKRIEQKDTSMIILDVRTPEEFTAGHIPGAINIPYMHLPARLSELPDAGDKEIVLYCATGIRAERAAERMREQGYTRLLHLDGDMKAWDEKNQTKTR
jgi:rhodanese-related sulfurtransferase